MEQHFKKLRKSETKRLSVHGGLKSCLNHCGNDIILLMVEFHISMVLDKNNMAPLLLGGYICPL